MRNLRHTERDQFKAPEGGEILVGKLTPDHVGLRVRFTEGEHTYVGWLSSVYRGSETMLTGAGDMELLGAGIDLSIATTARTDVRISGVYPTELIELL